jgi:hypothetical protein
MESKMGMGNYVVNYHSYHGFVYALLSFNVKIYYLINKNTNGVVCSLYLLQNSFIFVKEKDIKSMNQ